MSVIAVKNIRISCGLKQLVKLLAKKVQGQFEALNFAPQSKVTKMCYLRLSKSLNPQEVIHRINTGTKFNAFIPEYVPDLPTEASKKGKIPFQLKRKLQIREEQPPHQLMMTTHNEILIELQSKFTGLYNLSKKTNHKLMESIARTVFERLKQIMDKNPEAVNPFKLSQSYRKLHPHFGDFQLILSTLHRLQDSAGVARTQINDQELTAVSAQPFGIDNIPYSKLTSACAKYSEKIIKKISNHVISLNTVSHQMDTEEDVARKKVREEIKRLQPYIPLMVKEVITSHFIPQKAPFHRMRIYGEPFLPSRDHMSAFVKRFYAVKVMRSDRMHNLLRFNIPLAQFGPIIAMDGTVIGGAKLVIRSSDIPLYKLSKNLMAEISSVFGVQIMETETEPVDEDDHDDAEEDWSEEVAA